MLDKIGHLPIILRMLSYFLYSLFVRIDYLRKIDPIDVG